MSHGKFGLGKKRVDPTFPIMVLIVNLGQCRVNPRYLLCRRGRAAGSAQPRDLEAGVLSAEAAEHEALPHRGQPEVTAAPLPARGREVEAQRGRAVACVLRAGGGGAALDRG